MEYDVELTITYRHGKFFAAYLDLAEPRGEGRVKTMQLSDSVLLDIDPEGNPVGVEVLSRNELNEVTLNRLLAPHGVKLSLPSEINTHNAA